MRFVPVILSRLSVIGGLTVSTSLAAALALSAALPAILFPAAAHACEASDRVASRDITSRYKAAKRSVARAFSKLESQDRVIKKEIEEGVLSPDAALSPAPEQPDAALASVDDKGKVPLDCSDRIGVADLLAAAEAEVSKFEEDAAAFVAQVEARQAEFEALPRHDAEPPNRDNTEDEPSTDSDHEVGGDSEDGREAEAAEAEPTLAAPLSVDGSPLIYQRVLTLPDALLHDVAGGDPIPDGVLDPFSVLYVFDRQEFSGEEWLHVGAEFARPPVGWAPASATQAWNNMLVMQFADRGRRNRVLFWEKGDELFAIVDDFRASEIADEIYVSLKEGVLRDHDFGAGVVAAEPQAAVKYGAQPYLLPIIDFRREQFDSGEETTLLEVASVSIEVGADERQERDESTFEAETEDKDLADFSVGIVFVMDTTTSMQPYIERTYETVTRIYREFAEAGELKADFGLIAYRDNKNHNAKLDYVTRVYQALDPEADSGQVLANLEQVKAAPVATVDWREDGLAGLYEALEETDWEPFDAKIVIMITDASSRSSGDRLAALGEMSISRVAEIAESKGVAVVPMHLQTPEATNAGDVDVARNQYGELGRQTGDDNALNLVSLDATSDADFSREIGVFAADLVATLKKARAGKLASAESGVGDDSEADSAEAGSRAQDGDEKTDQRPQDGDLASDDLDAPGRLSQIVSNEILRAQLEFLGERSARGAPNFLTGWAADRDLADPALAALEVSVFLTRNQLSALAQSVEGIVDAFKAAETSSGDFFDQLQILAVSTATDPDAVKQDDQALMRELLPSFIRDLPYRSEILRLNRDRWAQEGTIGQQRIVERLEDKLNQYRDLSDQAENWVDFGSGDPALEAYPVALTLLP